MAVYFNGMTFAETGALTEVMLHSGDVIELHGFERMGLAGPFVDKHSTGGVGDKISLPLAPIVAACGVRVPMMSGRALGHTGGTLDKLEAIAGYRVNLSADEFRAGIAVNGFAMTGQTKAIVPADRLLYALRDVTGTVESAPLITASILSKKIAEGADALVFDVKYGSGAFMRTQPDAERLADSLVNTARALGKKASALITGMNTPLGRKIGNFLEIEETIECLQGAWPADVKELTMALGAQMLLLGNKAATAEEGRARCEEAVMSGEALRRFLRNIELQGGDPEKTLKQCGVRRSPHRRDLTAESEGYIAIDAFKVGLAGVTLGVGRNRTEDPVCPDAGVILRAVEGDFVKKGDVIMEIYGKDEACLAPATTALAQAVSCRQDPVKKTPLIA
jgi:pyrimidine-nucleoside phosphorylase